MLRKIGHGALVFLLSALLVLLSAASLAVIVFTAWAHIVPDDSLDDSLFLTGIRDRTTRLYYYTESGEAVELTSDRISGSENALYCPIEEIPEHLKNAFIAIEDKRFYRHGGVDWYRTLHAIGNYFGGDATFGGSTITQQLVKNLTGESERSVRRKIGELMRAAKVEKRLSKDEILEQYLNVVNLAGNCYGVKTAANVYFSKEPSELSLAECATIAAITNNPAGYDPIRHPEANRRRRDLILSEMRKNGMITQEEYTAALAEETELRVNRQGRSDRVNSWYADLVVSDVIDALVAERGMSRAQAGHLLYNGGLKIYTAMNPALQAAVEAYYEDTAHFPTHEGGKRAQSAVIFQNPKNGDVLAVAGAVGEKTSNRLQSYASDTRRPSGSVIKPLSVYAPALQRGVITYATVFDDIPLSFRENGAPWPRNSPNVYRGLTNVNEALTHSVNTVSVLTLRRLGIAESYRFLTEDLDFSSLRADRDYGVASLALGQQSEGVTLRETVAGYTALANEGVFTGSRSFYLVLDSRGEVLLRREDTERRVLSEENAALTTLMLRHVMTEGTGKSATVKNRVDVAGKTGTSSQNCDKWFVGYTPTLLAGVWYGHEYPESLSDVKGNPALAVWDDLMKEAVELCGGRGERFSVPETLVPLRYCRDSGKLVAEACRHDPRGDRSEIGYFLRGTEPTEYCDRHVLIDYCTEGGVATEHCPREGCYATALLRVSRHFPRQVRVLDAPYTYGGSVPSGSEFPLAWEPYYAAIGEGKEYYGIGLDVIPYNHICSFHTGGEEFWRRRRTDVS